MKRTNHSRTRQACRHRRGAILILAVLLITFMLGLIAFAVDIGCIVLVRTQLQSAADSAAMAAASSMNLPRGQMELVARKYADAHQVSGRKVKLKNPDVEYGVWDATSRTFTPSQDPGNAIRVTTRTGQGYGGKSPMFFGGIWNHTSFSRQAQAVAMCNPRDIAFVIDLSGSMNDDAEPCWATAEINGAFSGNLGDSLMRDLFTDLGFGSFPGVLEHVGQKNGSGQSTGVPQTDAAYAELTKNYGYLTGSSIPSTYRIYSSNSESTRKQKAYAWIIDMQLARIMPAAMPTPSSSQNYGYWEKYLDYLLKPYYSRGMYLPPNQDSQRITNAFNNPNRQNYPGADSGIPAGYRNKLGYRTYVQFMVDHGRELKPDGANYVPLSRHSAHCRWHSESTAGGTFSFPPREQPVHAARRALIAAMQVVKERNNSITDLSQRDWVSVISFDTLSSGGPVIHQALTGDYDMAMLACTKLQAVSDTVASTATEAGLVAARDHIKSSSEGGQGRRTTSKVVVLLTDGVPNLYVSSRSTVDNYIGGHPDGDYYRHGAYAYDAPLMQCAQMQGKKWSMFPVGVGLGTDYDFMDRLARMGGTANSSGESPRGSGNPADYEQRLTDIFEEIINNPRVRLVQ